MIQLLLYTQGKVCIFDTTNSDNNEFAIAKEYYEVNRYPK